MEKKYLSKIIANDNEGLQMISACSAGAKVKVEDIKYLPSNKVFLLSIERNKIETDNESKKINSICRFDFNASENCAEVSINLNPEMRGKGLASKLLFHSIKKYREGNLIQLKATIKKENIASIKIFKKCDFVQVDENDMCFFLKNRG